MTKNKSTGLPPSRSPRLGKAFRRYDCKENYLLRLSPHLASLQAELAARQRRASSTVTAAIAERNSDACKKRRADDERARESALQSEWRVIVP
jgi:hypothetical protein